MCNLFVYEGTDCWTVRHRDHDRDSHEYVLWKHATIPRARFKSYKRFYQTGKPSVPLPEKLDTLLRAFVALKGGSI